MPKSRQEDIAIGIVIGFFLTSLFFWYITKDNIPCNISMPSHTAPLEDCTPDYMGGCN